MGIEPEETDWTPGRGNKVYMSGGRIGLAGGSTGRKRLDYKMGEGWEETYGIHFRYDISENDGHGVDSCPSSWEISYQRLMWAKDEDADKDGPLPLSLHSLVGVLYIS